MISFGGALMGVVGGGRAGALLSGEAFDALG